VKFHLAIRAMRDAGTAEFFSGHRHIDGKWVRAGWYRLIPDRPPKNGEHGPTAAVYARRARPLPH
jgi:hypothetical protein